MNIKTGITITLTDLIKYRYQTKKLQIKRQSRVLRARSGNYHSKLRGRGMDFEEVRPYQPGDDIRSMDWRVTARTGIAHSKVYREEKERPVFLVVDFNPAMYFGTRVAFKSVIAAQIAALIAWTAVNNGDRVGGMICTPTQHIELRPRARMQGILPLLKNLAEATQFKTNNTAGNSFIAGLRRLNHVTKPGSLIYIISDFSSFNVEIQQQIQHLKQHSELTACFIYDQLEAQPPKPNHYPISDGQNILTINTADKLFSAHYQEQFMHKIEEINTFFKTGKIPFFEIATHDVIDSKILDVF